MDQRITSFDEDFEALSGFLPFNWQRRLFETLIEGDIPSALDLPTGLGKTSVMTIWLIARAHGAPLPRRLIYVVDRRAVVDQATEVAETLRRRLDDLPGLRSRIGLDDQALPISTLRGQYIDNREWLLEPGMPAIIVGTVDMVGSRLLFSGYGVSRKMRPYHAGFLGADSLVVLDEAHLVPPFEELLAAIEKGASIFGPRDASDRLLVPPLRLLSLSATGRERSGMIFRLRDEDIPDIESRLRAEKSLVIVAAGERPLEETLAEQAWMISKEGKANIRCLIYCDSRTTAEKTLKAIEERASGDKKKSVPRIEIATELFVGARRARERETARDWLKDHGFLAGSAAPTTPAFLVATSAGEVGVDLDADHMISDLAPWERMVQRLGRVNRRGTRAARVIVVADQDSPVPKKAEAPTPFEKRAMIAHCSAKVIEALRRTAQGFDASPGALRELKLSAANDKNVAATIAAATSPEPLRPALSRSLVDAWSLTSFEEHTGRPEIGPWIRGWIDDEGPQTSIVWRAHLPVRSGGQNVSRLEIEGFFDAAPPHASELLEVETWRAVDWLLSRAKAKLRQTASSLEEADSVVAFALSPAGEVLRRREDGRMSIYRHSDLVAGGEAISKFKERLGAELAGSILVVDAQVGGLSKRGLLDDAEEEPPASGDGADRWSVGFVVHLRRGSDEASAAGKDSFVFVTQRLESGDAEERLLIESSTTEESRAASVHAQLLAEHRSWAEQCALSIARSIGLPVEYEKVLAIAARLHDEGKQARRWQRAFRAPSDGVYAKTRGPLNRAWLDGYRHEFGSLPWAENDAAFRTLSDDGHKDLVLHLIAAHHGAARPFIETRGCEDAPPSVLEERARQVALRFARLQVRWGPWGLAWWEALLRAADQEASRRNDLRTDRSR